MGKVLKVFRNSKWMTSLKDLGHLLFPYTCLICENELTSTNHFICSLCRPDLPFTYYERALNPTSLDQLFWGRVPIHGTYAMFSFKKGGAAQAIIHALKYKNQRDIGIEFGRMMGLKINDLTIFNDLNGLVPVPLHPRKKFLRGYNQSEMLADGIGKVLKVPVLPNFMSRRRFTQSQTKKNRFQRFDNVVDKFAVGDKNAKDYRHIALVDDVVTTGATLEALAREIKENYPEIRISIISLAIVQ